MTGPTTTTTTRTTLVTEITAKRKQRIENKKKKMSALLDIVQLNEKDRLKEKHNKNESSEVNQCSIVEAEDIGHSPLKRLKIESEEEIVALGSSGKPKLFGEELMELKKMLREKSNKIKNAPKFWLRDMGEKASLAVPLDNRCPLFVSDIQHLLMYSQVGVHSPYSPARWCNLERYNRLSNTTLLIIENLSLYEYESNESRFPFISTNFDHKIELISPYAFNSDMVKELSMVPLSATQMRKLIKEYGSLEDAAKQCNEVFDTINHFFPIAEEDQENQKNDGSLPTSDKFPRTNLLLSGWQMIEENFPLPIKGLRERKYRDYVLTKDRYRNVTAHSPLIAIDCEMCKTESGDLELTRISVVNEKHEIIYDTLVKPGRRIVDYLTRFSGINSKMMRPVTTKLSDVQDKLRTLLPDDAILIGQSLSNDLHALKMMHPYVIDTSVIFNLTGDRMRKTKLQVLAREFLHEKIQVGTKGHCSSEDSAACMKLVQLKLKKHVYYGDAVMNAIYSEQRAYPDLGSANYAVSMIKQCVKNGNGAVNLVAVDELSDKYRYYIDKQSGDGIENVSCTRVDTNKSVIKRLCDPDQMKSLNIGHLLVARDCVNEEKVLKTIDKWVNMIHEAIAQPAFLIVLLSGRKEGGNGAAFLKIKRDFIT
ncbi:RNA exonuclease 5 isoform X2 [Anthonomus grandis grandis]|uniref:RNA exonuclease 5 isoform X2 n=1 Tax=Anthonomus grandis grandis TaxID=2921223 RepID=UPI0021657F4E|nr:RNA exonuclease 5 isoform X2 [Anthonomus grandis grandis]